MPERTYFAASLSKCIAPGLRVSFLMTPDRDSAGLLANALRASVQMPAFLMVAVVTRWLQDGSADANTRRSGGETEARCGSARTACVFATPEWPPHLDPFAAQLEQDRIRFARSKAIARHRYRRNIQRRGKPASRDSGLPRRHEQPLRTG
jgi:hypothetical protein